MRKNNIFYRVPVNHACLESQSQVVCGSSEVKKRDCIHQWCIYHCVQSGQFSPLKQKYYALVLVQLGVGYWLAPFKTYRRCYADWHKVLYSR